MAASRTLIFTACPNGVNGAGHPLVSVHIAPRLDPGVPTAPLSTFTEWEDWPSQGMTWTVFFGNLGVAANIVTAPAADSARWQALFAPTTPVNSRTTAEDMTGRTLRSYPVDNVVGHLQDNYATFAANNGDQYPDLSTLSPFLNPISPALINEAIGTINKELEAAPHVLPAVQRNPTRDFAQVRLFHTPPAVRQPPPGGNVQLPSFDFHNMVALAQDHPQLLRLLGLVVDLECTHFPDITLGNTTVYVVPTPTTPNGMFPGSPSLSSPRTSCNITRSSFVANPSAGSLEIADGYLRLDDTTTFGVIPIDQDGGSLKAMDLSALTRQGQNFPSIDTPTSYSLPVIRSRGLTVFETSRAASLKSNKMQRAVDLDGNRFNSSPVAAPPGTAITLFAEDITQGYRFDALDTNIATPVWRSLSERMGQFLFTSDNVTFGVNADEAMSNVGATGAQDGSSTDLYIGESIIHWNGWSLGAPRPSKAINNDDTLMDESSEPFPAGFPLKISFNVAPGTLPRLRFGHAYHFRARAVDLAGNGLPLSDASVAHASPRVLFGRFDPVESPAILLRLARTAGEAVNRVVLRSNYNTPASPPTNERHLIAPKVAELTAELHGMFDTPGPGSMVDVNAYNLIASHESKTVSDIAGAAPDPIGDGVDFFNTDHVTAPYLPDPVSIGATLRGVGGATNEVQVSWNGTWPDLGDVRVIMHEMPSPALNPPFNWNPALQQLDLYVAKADTLNVRLSTLPLGTLIDQFGLFVWIVGAGLFSVGLRTNVENGRNWMFTPFRPLTFVHAVKQPLVAFTWQDLRILRFPGDTFATLVGQGPFSRKSSARIDIDARWFEYIDDGPGAALPTRPDPAHPGAFLDRPVHSAVPISAAVPVVGADPKNPGIWHTTEVPTPGARHEFHDTKHRDVSYSSTVYSRFDEYFRQTKEVHFAVHNPFSLDPADGIVHDSMKVTSIDGSTTPPTTQHWTEGTDFSVQEAKGAGTITKLAGSLMPNKVEASWVPLPNSRIGPAFLPISNVPSSVRPDAPKMLYVIPTFQRQATSGTLGKKGSKRLGAGVRVYLERPWWVTGAGEMLAVVTAASSPGQNPLSTELGKLATQWGNDPVHSGKPTPDNPTASSFPLRVLVGTPAAIPELPGVNFTFIGHNVGFDATRDLWYCDIDIDTGATYFPFVRLALARWQPSSLGGLSISPVVLADYTQLAPDRASVVIPPTIILRGHPAVYGVSLTGPGYNATLSDQKGPRAQITVQQRIAAGMTGPLAWENVGAPIALTRFNSAGPTVTFTGSFTLPSGVAKSDLRILFEEFEQIETDGLVNAAPVIGDRVTYADVVPLG